MFVSELILSAILIVSNIAFSMQNNGDIELVRMGRINENSQLILPSHNENTRVNFCTHYWSENRSFFVAASTIFGLLAPIPNIISCAGEMSPYGDMNCAEACYTGWIKTDCDSCCDCIFTGIRLGSSFSTIVLATTAIVSLLPCIECRDRE